jgi:glutaredoxin/glutathione-dependent peroxiredoxin
MPIEIGATLPDVDIAAVEAGADIKHLRSSELFAGQKLVLVGVPGAFTPTCSERHLPGYVKLYAEFKARGVNIYCMAVNDAFVMKAWAASQHVPPGFTLLADGNASLTKALGLEMDGTAYGMGIRSRRFALYAEDGIVKLLHIEKPGELRVTTAEAMLEAIDR